MDKIIKFEKNTAEYIKGFNIQLNNKKIVVALSGGADSVALLLSLLALSGRFGYELSALHVNHGIRGAEADNDEKFCVELCGAKGIDIRVFHADIPTLAAEQKISLETCGRDYRYSALYKHCMEESIDYIATAHNANDNAETVLYNLLRGSGTDGLCGIPKMRDNIIRPLLGTERSDIEAYLGALGQEYVTDGTNSDNSYTRNYIRNVILPACKNVNVDAVGAINRASAAVEDDCALINLISAETKRDIDLRSLPTALQNRLIKSEYKKLFAGSLESAHINAIKNALCSTETKYISLPNNVRAVVCSGKLHFIKDGSASFLTETILHEGENLLDDGGVRVFIGTHGDEGVSIKKSAICGNLYVRSRQQGDKVKVRKTNRSIKKCFIDRKIPSLIRDKVPIVCDDKGIIYVPYIGVADRVYPKPDDEIIRINVIMDERFGF